MCSVNDAVRARIQSQIDTLNAEKASNEALIADAERCKGENEEALISGNCAAEALGRMSLGGDRILTATNICIKELNHRVEMTKEILEEAKEIQSQIEEKIAKAQDDYNKVHKDCGVCSECNPKKSGYWW